MVVENHIQKNVSADKKTNKKIPVKWLFILFVFMCELFVYTGVRVACTSIGYRIASDRKVHGNLEAYRSELMLEKARLDSPVRIFKIARTRLNLVMPGQGQIVYMNRKKIKR